MIIIKIKYSYPVKYINTKVHRLLVNTSTYHYKSSIPRNDTTCFRGAGDGSRGYEAGDCLSLSLSLESRAESRAFEGLCECGDAHDRANDRTSDEMAQRDIGS